MRRYKNAEQPVITAEELRATVGELLDLEISTEEAHSVLQTMSRGTGGEAGANPFCLRSCHAPICCLAVPAG